MKNTYRHIKKIVVLLLALSFVFSAAPGASAATSYESERKVVIRLYKNKIKVTGKGFYSEVYNKDIDDYEEYNYNFKSKTFRVSPKCKVVNLNKYPAKKMRYSKFFKQTKKIRVSAGNMTLLTLKNNRVVEIRYGVIGC